MKASVAFAALLLLDHGYCFYVHPHVQSTKVVYYGRATAGTKTCTHLAFMVLTEQLC
jgi:hypothetical protein